MRELERRTHAESLELHPHLKDVDYQICCLPQL